MNLKLLFEPKKITGLISENKIYYNFFYISIGVYLIPSIFTAVLYPQTIHNIIQKYQEMSSRFSSQTIIISFAIIIIVLILGEALMAGIIILLTKLALWLSKKHLTAIKIFNIYLYVTAVKYCIRLALIITMFGAIKLTVISGEQYTLIENFKNLNNTQIDNLSSNIVTIISFIIAFCLYIHVIRIAIETTKKIK